MKPAPILVRAILLPLAFATLPVPATTGCSAPAPAATIATLRVESRRANRADWDALPASHKLKEKINVEQRPALQVEADEQWNSPPAFEFARYHRCADGVEYLCDDMNRNLWYRTRPAAPWTLVLSDVRLIKTFGGCMPCLRVHYAGNERFIFAESLNDTEFGKGQESGASQITYLIDAKRGVVLDRSKPQRYTIHPAFIIPAEWPARHALPKVEEVDLDRPGDA